MMLNVAATKMETGYMTSRGMAMLKEYIILPTGNKV